MCFFPLPNLNYSGLAFKKGITKFDCGACPECLQKRSSRLALTSVYEAKSHSNCCMITLTYDSFARDSEGNIIRDSRGIPVENPVDPDLKVNKRHVQLFIKRLRKWISYYKPFGCDSNIKYRACAEYGSRTHRAHYHVLLFGVNFPDRHFYKKSKRGNPIYMSSTLTKLWNHGICTIDSVNVHSAVARYCTKYCAKTRSDKTFMLSSQNIGLEELLKDFNGRSYFIDGREYSIPRSVWQVYISRKYFKSKNIFSYKYINRDKSIEYRILDKKYLHGEYLRKMYRFFRDHDSVYQSYISYWSSRAKMFEQNKPSVETRIRLLPEDKYHFYKIAALDCLCKRNRFIPVTAPGSNCVSYYERYKFSLVPVSAPRFFTCLSPSRPNKASDTKKRSKYMFCPFDNEPFYDFRNFIEIFCFKNIDKTGIQCYIDIDNNL